MKGLRRAYVSSLRGFCRSSLWTLISFGHDGSEWRRAYAIFVFSDMLIVALVGEKTERR